ncbi:MAG: primosomal protein N' [Kiritimatiellae bacterium]|nr:primosomal protein N' [Kiritimatiellia bacterium]
MSGKVCAMGGKVAKIAIDGTSSGVLFDYAVPDSLADKCGIGFRVRVEFGRRKATGYVVDMAEAAEAPRTADGKPPRKLKPIEGVDGDRSVILPPLMRLARWMARYYIAPIERCVQTLLPSPVRSGRSREVVRLYVEAVEGAKDDALTPRQKTLLADIARVGGGWLQQVVAEFKCTPDTLRRLEKAGVVTIEARERRRDPFAGRRVVPSKPLPLNDEQKAALDLVLSGNAGDAKAPPKPVLLFGVTGSGKTEVYLQSIAAMLAQGRGAIVLVPEIALTPQTVQRFASRFGESIAVLHSALSDGERFDEWRRIREGKARVVVGPRSAVFAPVENLGLIVVDEEHEPSYKQDESPRYNARDVAVMRAHLEGASIILGSATPSLESWNNAQIGKYVLARLSRRAAADACMPLVHIIDMRREVAETGKGGLFSRALMDAIHDRLSRGEQTLLFLNRRGYATSLVCQSCGYVATCDACEIPFTYHKRDDCLRCHICGTWRHVPAVCPSCGEPGCKCLGTGTQRIEEIVSKCFPHARVARMDADSTSRKFSHDDILGDFKAGRTDILIGTQMIAKGLHFPNVTLAGIMMADSSLRIPDFRAGERTFQLLAQVSGRTGRGAIAGEVFVQTFSPEHPAVQMARTENFADFAKGELASRRELGYPPFSHLARIALHGPDEGDVASLLGRIAAAIRAKAPKDVRISDVVPSSLAKACDQYRYEIIMRAPSVARMEPAITSAISSVRVPDRMRLAIDIDAISVC